MNNSGYAVKPLVTSKKAAEQLVVLHDDLDLPLGTVKVSFGRVYRARCKDERLYTHPHRHLCRKEGRQGCKA